MISPNFYNEYLLFTSHNIFYCMASVFLASEYSGNFFKINGLTFLRIVTSCILVSCSRFSCCGVEFFLSISCLSEGLVLLLWFFLEIQSTCITCFNQPLITWFNMPFLASSSRNLLQDYPALFSNWQMLPWQPVIMPRLQNYFIVVKSNCLFRDYLSINFLFKRLF